MKKLSSRILTTAALLLMVPFSAAPMRAQEVTGSIRGTVFDPSGAGVPSATVTATQIETGQSRTAACNREGTYVLVLLPVGNYRLEASAPGFQKFVQEGITLSVNEWANVPIHLAVGLATQSVEVTANAALIETADTTLGKTVGEREILDLPLNGRDFSQLGLLQPGVVPITPGLAQAGGSLRDGQAYSVNGQRPESNNFLIDGASNVDAVDGGFVLKPPIDAIAEFKILTHTANAEFGSNAGSTTNIITRSGSNEFHGGLWEFLRNDKLDSADFFQNATGSKKGEFRQNQFGATVGGPIRKNKTFFFADYEGTRIRQAVPQSATVPTQAEISSGYTNFSDMIALQSGQLADANGKNYPIGTVFDPATTTSTGNGQYVRQPFAGNIIPASRLDPNAVKLLALFPGPTQAGLYNNYNVNRGSSNDVNAVDGRLDEYFSERDQVFARFSWSHNPQFIPGPFAGFADGGGFGAGDQIVNTMGAALSYTHSFGPTLVNEARVGFNREHTSRVQPFGDDTSNIPGQFGIEGVLQTPGNGGLPYLGIGGLSQLGSTEWLVSDRFSNTIQFTENLTKIYGKHTFKAGVEIQQVGFPWIAPPYSRGGYDFNGQFTSIPNVTDNSTGRAQFLLAPTAAGIGGPDNISLSNFGGVAADRAYRGAFVQDDWKVTPKLTLNLGVRWDYFTPTGEKYGAQANFVPGNPFSGAEYIIPSNRQNNPPLSASFMQTLQQDGIQLVYSSAHGGSGLSNVQNTNFAPRFGFAYQATSRLVVRGGYGMFYGAFENRGGYPSLGYNYPFQYSFYYFAPNSQSPMVLPNGQTGTLENSIAGIPLNPALVQGSGLTLRGIQLNYKTPYVQSYNLTLQYQLSHATSLEAGYVASLSRHLETFVGTNNASVLLPPGTSITPYIPFPDFSPGSPYDDTIGTADYHSLQTKLEHRFSKGLNFLVAYTFSKTLTDAGDLLSGGGTGGFRAPDLPGFGIKGDWGLAPFDVRHSFVASGSYDLPWGRGRTYMSSGSKLAEGLLGGWSVNWILSLHSGNPQTIGCTYGTGADNGCFALYSGASLYTGQGVEHFYNAAAFSNPAVVTQVGQTNYAPLGGGNTQVSGPGFHRLDFSLFKAFPITERKRFEFRIEAFNLTNTPNFAQPGNLNFLDTLNFAKITSTVDNPNDPRELQLALKFYF